MDAAQVARNVAEGKGFSTHFIRPFSVYLIEKHNDALIRKRAPATTEPTCGFCGNLRPASRPRQRAAVSAGARGPLEICRRIGRWKSQDIWSEGGQFVRVSAGIFHRPVQPVPLAGRGAADVSGGGNILGYAGGVADRLAVLGSDLLWKFSVSGLPTLFLLVIFLGLVWCLATFEIECRAEKPGVPPAVLPGWLAGLLTAAGHVDALFVRVGIVPVVLFLALFGPPRAPPGNSGEQFCPWLCCRGCQSAAPHRRPDWR